MIVRGGDTELLIPRAEGHAVDALVVGEARENRAVPPVPNVAVPVLGAARDKIR